MRDLLVRGRNLLHFGASRPLFARAAFSVDARFIACQENEKLITESIASKMNIHWPTPESAFAARQRPMLRAFEMKERSPAATFVVSDSAFSAKSMLSSRDWTLNELEVGICCLLFLLPLLREPKTSNDVVQSISISCKNYRFVHSE